ncbi:lactonase family protein [Herbaspirillum sp. NPDC087042]|uniref:lactonase family protein n=1 Tax=Herbaspirillum sp. NPDC087042 TaxID=3364004 RepID=UPI0037F75287
MTGMLAYTGCRTTRQRNARGKGIGVYAIEEGRWRLLDIQPTQENPSFLALDAAQAVLYTVHGDGGEVSSFRIDEGSGKLMHLNTVDCLGRNPVHLDFSADGRYLLVANYASGDLARLPILGDGALGTAVKSDILPGTPGPNAQEQGSAHPHFIGRYATAHCSSHWHIVPDKGLDTVFAINWQEHARPVITSCRWRAGSGPRHAAFHPQLPLVYVANELDCTMTVWRFDHDSGELTPLHTVATVPEPARQHSSAAGIVMHPGAHALYVSNRGHDSVCVIALDAASGMPTARSWVSGGGDFPRFITLDPPGHHLYVANERSDSIVQFAVDPGSAALAPTGLIVETGSPVSIVFRTK